ncbi:MAG TPA: acyltransferase [Polyangiaceae bacterium]|nr:acyltransferase [Polyangiaceae bacterium]
MTALAQRSSTRNAAIDLLRAWAVLAVVALHLNIRVPFNGCALGRSLPKPLYAFLFWSGYPAVIVFFVVSGFLITNMTVERWGALERCDLPRFYRLRFARLFPALALFVVVQSGLQSANVQGFFDLQPSASLPRTWFAVATFHLNCLEARVGYLPGAWDVLWSLCVEELFYLGFPLLARWAKPPLLLSAVLLGFVILGPFARVSFSQNPIWMDHSYLSCMGEIAIGCLTALLVWRYPLSSTAASASFIVGAGLVCLVLYFRRAIRALGLYDLGLDVSVLALGSAALLAAFVSAPHWSRWAESRAFAPLRALGESSYEVYLSHLFLVIPLTLLFKRLRCSLEFIPLFYAVCIVATALLGILLSRLYSKPFSARLR